MPEKLDWAFPTEDDTQGYSFAAIWQSVLPGKVLRILIVRRPHLKNAPSPKKQKRYLEVFFTTNRRLAPEQALREYQGRWYEDSGPPNLFDLH